MPSEIVAQLYRENLDIDPYQDREYLSDSVGDPPNDLTGTDVRTSWEALKLYGRNIWRYSRMALNYWSPERVEQEAYRRAGNEPSLSRIAVEVARFNVLYAKWVELGQGLLSTLDLALAKPTLISQVDFMRESMAETLFALERRAQAAEQRATDLRLRYEFEMLRASVSGRAMASEIATMIEEAIKNAGTEETVYQRFAPALTRLEKEIEHTKLDIQFVADLAGDEFVARQLPRSKVGPAALKLVEVVPGIPGKVLVAVVRLFLGG